MRHYLTIACLIALFYPILSHATVLRGNDADAKITGTNVIWTKAHMKVPTYIQFQPQSEIPVLSIFDWMNRQLELQAGIGFDVIREEVDKLGHTHIKLQQTYNDVPVAFAHYTLHLKNGMVYALSGDIHQRIQAPQGEGLSEKEALKAALNHIGAVQYKWEFPEEEEAVKLTLNDPSFTFQPIGVRTIVPKGAQLRNAVLRYAWKFDIYAHQPESRREIYIDVINGDVLFENSKIHEADVPAKAVSAFSDTVDITTDSFMGTYRLNETGRGQGIHTWNMETRTNTNSAVEFTDIDNFWNNFNAQKDQYATDAHWGAEMTYDYMLARFNRNSIDNNGFRLNSYVHYDQDWSNASWNGFSMRYGDGTPSSLPFTTLDVSGHEIGHGLTDYTADLVYQDEFGALNESFSDILGASIEFFVKQGNGNWLIGEDRGSPLRDMANPRTFGDPHTYQGNGWISGNIDNGGVHTNSGVQNFWYYLLTEGGNGTNDRDSSYSVQGIGLVDASNIAYRNLSVYLSRLSEYEDAMFFSIQSAIDLFGSCSQQHESTVNAWFAVGLGKRFVAGVSSSFDVDVAASCQLPFLAHFTNSSQNGTDFFWDFGDGSTSTESAPSHLYKEKGVYPVSLKAEGGACGENTLVKEEFIQLIPAQIPSPLSDTVASCPGEIAMLSATVDAGELQWYAEENGTVVFTGPQYQAGPLERSQDFYVENVIHFPEVKVGPEDNTFGGGRFSNANEQVYFEVYQPLQLISVLVYSNVKKVRTIELYNDNDSLLERIDVDIEKGEQRVPLGFMLQPGFNYRIGFKDNTSPQMWIVEEAGAYPYSKPGILSITGNTSNTASRYFFFFDWEVKPEDCISAKTKIHAAVDCSIPQNAAGTKAKIYPNPSAGEFLLEAWFSDGDYLKAQLFNTNGQLVKDFDKQPMAEGYLTLPLSLIDIAPGVYFLNIETNQLNQMERLIIGK
jgi:Zn-dependent metalloprotease